MTEKLEYDDIIYIIETMDYIPDVNVHREVFWEYESEYSDGNVDYSLYGG